VDLPATSPVGRRPVVRQRLLPAGRTHPVKTPLCCRTAESAGPALLAGGLRESRREGRVQRWLADRPWVTAVQCVKAVGWQALAVGRGALAAAGRLGGWDAVPARSLLLAAADRWSLRLL